jgi:hypothetical protein
MHERGARQLGALLGARRAARRAARTHTDVQAARSARDGAARHGVRGCVRARRAHALACPRSRAAPPHVRRCFFVAEVVKNNLNPVWSTALVIDYFFEEQQALRFRHAAALERWQRVRARCARFPQQLFPAQSAARANTVRAGCSRAARCAPTAARSVVDCDKLGKDGSPQGDALGTVDTTVGAIVAARGGRFTAPLVGPGAKRGSTLTVVPEEMAASKGTAVLALRGIKLANRCVRVRILPCVERSRSRLLTRVWRACLPPATAGSASPTPSGASPRCARTALSCKSPSPVRFARARTHTRASVLSSLTRLPSSRSAAAVVMNNLNPVWQPVRVAVQRLCNGDLQRPLRLEVLDYDKDDAFKPIGHADTNAAALLATGSAIELKHPRGKPKSVGTVTVASAQVLAQPTFVDYLAGGLEISLLVGIDLTASNGEPSDPRSLHYRGGGGGANPYQIALAAVGAVLAPYDADGKIPAYGYGAALPPSNVVSHCFALSGRADDPSCDGVAGVLAAYDTALSSVRLSGPTCFAPLITAAAQAAASAAGLSYHVLLIITDGEIMDLDATVNALVRASHAPLSLVIVGVGDADFGAMAALDSDHGMLRGSAGVAVRDIVQFVCMRDYGGRAAGARLARDVLAEVPGQVVGHFMARGVAPPPPRARVPPSDSTRF